MEPEGALNLSTQQHAGKCLKEKQEDMQESFTGKAGHTHTIYIPAPLQAFLFPGNFFQQHFLPSTVAWSELCHFTTFSLLFETTKHLSIFLFSSRIERPVAHIQSVDWNGNSPTQCSLKERHAGMQRWGLFLSWELMCSPVSLERDMLQLLSLLVYQSAAINTQISCLITCELRRVNNHSGFAEKNSWEEIHQ